MGRQKKRNVSAEENADVASVENMEYKAETGDTESGSENIAVNEEGEEYHNAEENIKSEEYQNAEKNVEKDIGLKEKAEERKSDYRRTDYRKRRKNSKIQYRD